MIGAPFSVQNVLLRVPHHDGPKAQSLLDQFIWGSSYRCPLTRNTPLVEYAGKFISFWVRCSLLCSACSVLCTSMACSSWWGVSMSSLPSASAATDHTTAGLAFSCSQTAIPNCKQLQPFFGLPTSDMYMHEQQIMPFHRSCVVSSSC